MGCLSDESIGEISELLKQSTRVVLIGEVPAETGGFVICSPAGSCGELVHWAVKVLLCYGIQLMQENKTKWLPEYDDRNTVQALLNQLFGKEGHSA